MTEVLAQGVSDPRFAELASRYFGRTARSREIAREGRRHLADPRSLVRLNRGWEAMDYPILCDSSDGAHVVDVDGNEYVDLTMGFGINLFGHRPAFVQKAVSDRIESGWHLAADIPLSTSVAAELCEMTGAERAMFVTTGSEATMTAVRLARTVTNRDIVAVFANSYHGWYDELFAMPASLAMSGTANASVHGNLSAADGRAVPVAAGVPTAASGSVVIVDYGREEALARIRELGDRLAAVLVEPVQTRAPQLQPRAFLGELRSICDEAGVVLIFDEMITGFRLGAGGAQEHFAVAADLSTYGKILGGGMPIAAVAGTADLLDAVDGGAAGYLDAAEARRRTTAIAGTYARHPLALASARAVLGHIRQEGKDLYNLLDESAEAFSTGLERKIAKHDAPFRVARCGSMVRVYCADQALRELLSYHLVARGVYVCESRTWFLSTAHTQGHLDHVVEMIDDALGEMRDHW